MERKLVGAALKWHLFNVPFGWLGSKATMLDIILPNIPEHRYYVEPFCGTAIVYLHKRPVKISTLNDIDGNIVNFFRVLQDRDKTRELLRRLRYTPWAKAEYKRACLLLSSNREIDDITRAWAFSVAQSMNMKNSYYSDPEGKRFYYSLNHKKGNAAHNAFIWRVRRLVDNAHKLCHCQILNEDGIEVMRRFDGNDVFMFVDPPYLSTTVRSKSKIYATAYNDDLHYILIDFVLTAKSKIMLCSYPNKLYDRLLDYGWRRIDVEKPIYASHHTPNRRNYSRRIESLYLNYQPPSLRTHVASSALPLA